MARWTKQQRKTKPMYTPRRNTLVALSLIGALAVPPAFAGTTGGDAGRQEKIGLGTGALLGVVAGGPPGLIVGAIGGALLGRIQDTEDNLAEREQALQQSSRSVADLQQDIQQRNRLLNDSRQRSMLASSAIARGFAYGVQFRSDSARLEPHYQAQLQKLAGALTVFGDLTVHLAGHADPRGSDRHNLDLSQRRVEAVRDYLQQQGVAGERIVTGASGERQAMSSQGDAEGQCFDRRVHISFSQDHSPS